MKIPILDAFILSLLDRGAESAYDLHQEARISLGASTPSLLRLTKLKLAVRKKSASSGKRTRHVFRLTVAGRKAARTTWKELIEDESRIFDLDSTIRIADMAAHYGATRLALTKFLRRAGAERLKLSDEAAMKAQNEGSKSSSLISTIRTRCEAGRLRTEAEILLTASDAFKRGRDPIDGQQPLL